MNDWFDQKDKLEIQLGIKTSKKVENDPKLQATLLKNLEDMMCPICYEEMEEGQYMSLACGHTFCNDCWTNFLMTEVKGTKSLNQSEAMCQQQGCNLMVTHSMFTQLLKGT